MRKKIIITAVIFCIIITGTIIILNGKKQNIIKIAATSWYDKEDEFVLGEIEIEDEEGYTIPVDKDEFIQLITNSSEFIGRYPYTHLGTSVPDCFFYFCNDSMYVLSYDKENYNFALSCCDVMYSSQDDYQTYFYPAPADFEPSNSAEIEQNEYYDFDESFGNYEECVERFYKYFSERVVVLNNELKTVTIIPYSYYEKSLSSTHRVVIDFMDKKVMEKITE